MYDYAKFMAELERKNPAQPEFIQAAGEIVASVIDTVNSNPLYLKNRILDRITEPGVKIIRHLTRFLNPDIVRQPLV